MNDRLHKSIYGQTLDEMKENKGAWEYKQEPYICDTCKHNDKEWDEEPCDGCCGNHSGYEPSGDVRMSREEAIEYIAQSVKSDVDMALVADAIEAIEQEPSGDLISRKNTLAEFKRVYFDNDTVIRCAELILGGMPSVTPQPKTGHWIEKDGFDGDTYYDCSECGESFCLIDGTPTDNLYNYCPNCGAKMESEET